MNRQRSWSITSFHRYKKNGQHKQVVSSASKDHLPRVNKTNCSTTGFESVSQFKASNRGLILRSRSSTIRFWFA